MSCHFEVEQSTYFICACFDLDNFRHFWSFCISAYHMVIDRPVVITFKAFPLPAALPCHGLKLSHVSCNVSGWPEKLLRYLPRIVSNHISTECGGMARHCCFPTWSYQSGSETVKQRIEFKWCCLFISHCMVLLRHKLTCQLVTDVGRWHLRSSDVCMYILLQTQSQIGDRSSL